MNPTPQSVAMAAAALPMLCSCAAGSSEERPNIVIIYADDMGYGDMSCQNPNSKIQTPALDHLAAQGTRFTDAHSSSGVSSPSRFGLLTGVYHWRRAHTVLSHFEPNHFFKDGDLTMAQMLSEAGYHTAMVGKWHLGWDWDGMMTDAGRERLGNDKAHTDEDGRFYFPQYQLSDFDFTRPFRGGPVDYGFDYYYGDGTINEPPFAWFENDRLVTMPTEFPDTIHINSTEGGKYYIGGPRATDWNPEDVLPTLADKAVEVINAQSEDQPFFLYFPLSAPHAPILPSDEFKGSSEAGPFGDFVQQCDDIVARVMKALEDKGLADNTIVVFSADNGPERYAYDRIANYNHDSTESLRGVKRDVWEGGHRVPFIIRWDGHVPAGRVCDEVISQVDLMASFASIVGYDLSNDVAVDSYDISPVLLGEEYVSPIREASVHNTKAGRYGLRQGDWLMINDYSGTHTFVRSTMYGKGLKEYKKGSRSHLLFNLKEDQMECNDLSERYPERVEQMEALLKRYQESGRSAPLR